MNLSDHDIERIAEAVCRRLDRRESAREDARYLAGMDMDDLSERLRALSRAARRGKRNEGQLEAETSQMGHARRG